ncbi:hypothetical protein BDM02DRAFT_3103475 [Thelephora ganbajun]|uniref:Uncharacterized protein n=1 Tax=Thelephora ganbajun TaxID=370292 RepID=A0ACB6Z3C0_THEGA|nr:hypothetical protein BDM02DRAFT_3103475 [Thelephora ganbajun]
MLRTLSLIFPTLVLIVAHPITSGSQTVIAGKSSSEYQGWFDPRVNGGRFLDYTNPKPPYSGEPLNIIITAFSDPYILTDEGFQTYYKSIGYSEECLGIHLGNKHNADLGDGDERKVQQLLARQYFPVVGTCWESLAGGHHFRAWKQNGSLANSGAWFIGASKEEPTAKKHMIVPDGYNIGRNWFVEKATAGSHWKGKWWKAEVERREGLLKAGKDGVNHGIEQDGIVAILTIHRL